MMRIQRAGMVTAEKGILVAFLIVTLVSSAGKSHSFLPCIKPQTPFLYHTKWKVISVLGQSMRIIDRASLCNRDLQNEYTCKMDLMIFCFGGQEIRGLVWSFRAVLQSKHTFFFFFTDSQYEWQRFWRDVCLAVNLSNIACMIKINDGHFSTQNHCLEMPYCCKM